MIAHDVFSLRRARTEGAGVLFFLSHKPSRARDVCNGYAGQRVRITLRPITTPPPALRATRFSDPPARFFP